MLRQVRVLQMMQRICETKLAEYVLLLTTVVVVLLLLLSSSSS